MWGSRSVVSLTAPPSACLPNPRGLNPVTEVTLEVPLHLLGARGLLTEQVHPGTCESCGETPKHEGRCHGLCFPFWPRPETEKWGKKQFYRS